MTEGWISVKDRLPDDEEKVLTVTKYPAGMVLDWMFDIQRCIKHVGGTREWREIEAHFWMPLPAPPKGESL